MVRRGLALGDIHIGDTIRTAALRGVFGVKIVLRDYHPIPGTSFGEGIVASINDEPDVNLTKEDKFFVFYKDKSDEYDMDY